MAALQLTVDSLDAIPENIRTLYRPDGEKFRLDVDGVENTDGLKSALQKEREAAKNATKEVNAWKALGKTPEEIQEALNKQRDFEDQQLMTEKKFEELQEKRTERMQLEHDKQLKEREDAIAKLNAKAAKLAAGKVAGSLTQAATKAGALPEAMEDIVLRGQQQGWTVNDDGDVVVLRDSEPVLGKDGKTPLTLAEWAETLRENAPHLWPRAQGSNAPGSGAAARGGIDLSKLPPAERITKARELGYTK